MTLVAVDTFQIALDLPPGIYQYKFLVDSTSYFDHEQLVSPDGCGTILNNLITVEPALIAPRLHTEIPRSSMYVNHNGVFQHSLSDCDVSRCHLSMHLSKYTAYELLPKSGKVTLFVVEFSVKKAFHITRKLGLAVVPLWDDRNGQLSGMLTASDFISMLMEHYKNNSLLPPSKV